MREFLHYLFLPHETNNFRARTLHPAFLINYILTLFLPFAVFLLLLLAKPGILGITANFVPVQIIAKTNEVRFKAGVGNLTENQKLSQAAQKKAEDMVSKGYWAHYAPDGKVPWDFIREAGYNFTAAGENLARDFEGIDPMISAWFNSPSHAENLLSKNFTEIGIGVAEGVISGKKTTVVVQMFGKPTFIPVAAAPAPLPAQAVTTLEAQPLKVETPQAAVQPAQQEIINVEKISKGFVLNHFRPSKVISLSVTLLIAVLVMADFTFAKFARVTRAGGHPIFHLTILAIIFLAIWYSNSGLIL